MTMPKGWNNSNNNANTNNNNNLPLSRKQKKLSHHKTNLEISLQDVWRQIQQEEQKHQDKYLKKHDPPSLPQLLPDEQIFWRRNLTQGWLKKKVVEVQMITSRAAVRVNDGALDLQTVDRIEIANRHSRGRGKGITYSVGGRGVGPRMHFSEGESRS